MWVYFEQTTNPIERYKSRISVNDDAKDNFHNFKKNVIDFLGVKDQATRYGLGQFDLKLFRLSKVDGKLDNFAIYLALVMKLVANQSFRNKRQWLPVLQ